MRTRAVKRIVDLTRAQQRTVIYASCGHFINVIEPYSDDDLAFIRRCVDVGEVACGFCPDPPPVSILQQRTARQLYRDAGEP
jgi:hypothetical protein